MTRENYFDLLIRMEPRIRKMLKRVCKVAGVSVNLAEEAWSDVILERAARVVELWDPSRNVSIDSYFLISMRWYTKKWINRRHKFISGRLPRGNDAVAYESAASTTPDDKLEVELLLDRLEHPFDRWIIRRHALDGYTFKEIRIVLGVSKSAARCYYNRAMRKLADLAGVDYDDIDEDN